tara:strand:- start:957 stop:1130 length:174 start_codon:yes stop_codon:yes gene_type:complete
MNMIRMHTKNHVGARGAGGAGGSGGAGGAGGGAFSTSTPNTRELSGCCTTEYIFITR